MKEVKTGYCWINISTKIYEDLIENDEFYDFATSHLKRERDRFIKNNGHTYIESNDEVLVIKQLTKDKGLAGIHPEKYEYGVFVGDMKRIYLYFKIIEA